VFRQHFHLQELPEVQFDWSRSGADLIKEEKSSEITGVRFYVRNGVIRERKDANLCDDTS
jgi:hypothetical protein